MESSTRRTRRIVTAALSAVALMSGLVACAPLPPATRVVDQSNVASESRYTEYIDGFTCNGTAMFAEAAQTFTAGRTGLLDQVSLNAWPISASSAPMRITIRTIRADGAPGDVVLGSGSYAGLGTPPYVTGVFVDMPLAHPALIFAGHRYALVLSIPPVADCPSGSVYGWFLYGTSDHYTGGQALTRGNYANQPDWTPVDGGSLDLNFKTWVTGH